MTPNRELVKQIMVHPYKSIYLFIIYNETYLYSPDMLPNEKCSCKTAYVL